MKLSKSAVLTYLQCPNKFRLQYIERIPQEAIKALERGTEIHSLVEEFFKHERKIEEAKNETLKKVKDEEHKKAIDHIERFAKQISRDGKTILVPVLQETKMYDPTLNFSGVVDAVFIDGSDVLVLDWKTGQEHPLEQYRFELSMYKYLVEVEHPAIRVTHYGIYFVDKNKLVIEEANMKETIKSIELIKEVRKRINEKMFEKNPGWYCKFCPYFGKQCDGKR